MRSPTKIRWFNGVIYTTTELYAHYGLSKVESNSGLTVDQIVWECITKGSCNPIVNGSPVFGITPKLVS